MTTETVKYKLGYTEYNNYIKQLILKLSRENVFYIKFFQAACTIKSPLLTDELTSFLTTFTDNVPYSSYEIDHDSLQSVMNEFSVSIKKPFVPIKSGTISLIFEGTIHDKPVIIKCKRIGIDNKIHNAIFHMNHLISISMLIPHIKNLNVHEIYSENKQSVLDQLSFENEVSNIKMFYSKWNKPGLDYIKIPRVYSDITMKVPSVIVMERIFGKTITQIDTDEKDKYALLLAKFNFKSVFYDGIYHGDFHPGNVFFLKENKVVGSDNDDNDDNEDDGDDAPYTYKLGIIDFGIIGILTRELQNVIYNLFLNLYEKNHHIRRPVMLGAIRPRGCHPERGFHGSHDPPAGYAGAGLWHGRARRKGDCRICRQGEIGGGRQGWQLEHQARRDEGFDNPRSHDRLW